MAASLVPERRPFDLRYAPPPSAAVEISGNRISVAAIELRGSGALVTAHAAEYLPDGAVVPSLTAANIAQREGVAAALTRVLDEIGRPRRIGLVLPDPVAKVSLVKFEQLPPRAQDLDQLVRWQARKSAPFPIDEAQVSYSPGERVDGGYEFIVSLARRSVVEEYEGLCVAAGAHAGLVDISSFNVINTLLAGTMPPAGDWLLVNVASQYVSIAILRGEHLMFFRSRGSDGEGGMADLVHQTAMYYEDRLEGAGFARVLLTGASSASQNQPMDVQQMRRSIEERLRTSVEMVDVRHAVSLADRITAGPGLLDALAPLVGLLLRDRRAAA
jgi:Tfp pilus assembly PilM family ATPase